MARMIGSAGDFQREQGLRRRLRAIMAVIVLPAVMCYVLGFVTAKNSLLWMIVAGGIIVAAARIFEKLFDKQIRMARSDEKGPSGEREVLKCLEELPDTYTVLSDLTFADSHGNIDHLVIGATGVYAIDVKNWRGTVSADGKGELLCNGKSTDKPAVRHFMARTLDLKDRLREMTKLDPYVEALFVFPHTHVAAKWGSTGHVRCMRADQVEEYITKGGRRSLSAEEAGRLSEAAEMLGKKKEKIIREIR